MEGAESEPTRIMVAVNESSIKGYPFPSISSRYAFDWTLQKIVRSNISGFKLLFLHVQVPDEDGDPKEQICYEVKRVRPDLLVLGEVVGLALFKGCPVVTIKRKADETPLDPVDD
ncbi:universal stress protein A-like protein isoform X2 [Macadamia integrifolia]|uniref:universal stress protein A-like protein isoform X2 n=1 Tax=Macadamia integrifolia TaxID=60698 RepID=UPI001C501D6B|nr:universal stress protein A-like protein isoform X2 [Macadamia integrifolia]